MNKKDFTFVLPPELIAQDPLEDRSSSRLMVLDKRTGEISHHVFSEIVDYLEPGDCLVLNDTKVLPARLFGEKKETGAHVEVLLLNRRNSQMEGCGESADKPSGNEAVSVKELEKESKKRQYMLWEALVRPGRKCQVGTKLTFGGGLLEGEVLDTLEGGSRLIRFAYEGIWEELLDQLGEMPLPPYITHKLQDKNRYQTVYAKEVGSAAAPTAGLHFTQKLLEQIQAKGVDCVYVTLHVGLGTFRPVKEEDVLKHHMHEEVYAISQEAADQINAARTRGGRIICVGTTSCRTLESAGRVSGKGQPIQPGSRTTDIFLYPGCDFWWTDGLITNFHLPESTLLMLVSALAGRENVLRAYQEAIANRYRFYSFGDAMFIR
jgi:S-adenosylmethionine:tRNA ribosyltransferase-isomerase